MGKGSVEDDGQSGRPKDATVDENGQGQANPGYVW